MRIERTHRRSRGPGLTALVDVVFLLLLFFILASTFATFSGVDIELAVPGAAAQAERVQTVLLVVKQDGHYAIDGEVVAVEALGGALRERQGDEPVRVIVRPSGDASAQDVLTALERARAAEVGPVILAH